jgi:hypothetical protein
MTAIKPLSTIADKWAGNSAMAGSAYTQGVQNPRRSWADAAGAADDRRKAGLAAADARDAFRKGVQAAGDAKWKQNASTLGPSRFASGVQNAKPGFNSGFAPYHSVIGSLTLPPRGAKGSPENLQRVAVVANALHAAKVGA